MELEIVRTGIEKKFYELVQEIVAKEGLELYAMDYINGQQMLRLFIQDKESKTAQLEDCARVDRAMTPYVEELDWMPEELTLEVSSPGIYRDIKEAKKFSEVCGERLQLTLNEKLQHEDFIEGAQADKKIMSTKKVMLYLVSMEGEDLFLSREKEGAKEIKINITNIKKANVEPLWEDLKDT